MYRTEHLFSGRTGRDIFTQCDCNSVQQFSQLFGLSTTFGGSTGDLAFLVSGLFIFL
jgi:hypothetical protein